MFDPPPFDSRDIGVITPDEQADALRTMIAVFATSVVRPDRPEPRNAISAEILDILDEVPDDEVEPVSQLFAMMVMRLRRRSHPRHTTFRLAVEAAVLAHKLTGHPAPESETAYLATDQPGLSQIDAACDMLFEEMDGMTPGEVPAWLTAHVIAAALIHADLPDGAAPENLDRLDLGVAEFLVRAAAQYLYSTSGRPEGDDEEAG
ncbi:MAG TPA: hypothetical protein VEB64_16345 [Azospirillaceae bacterium]|nr:hypothetical protein [Azospirillaceae bacterium]